jgi:O-antigen ligase
MRRKAISQPTLIGSWLVLCLLTTALLSLQTASLDYIFPYAPYLQLALQISVFILLIPFLRIKIHINSAWLLLGISVLFLMALASSFWSLYPELVVQRTLMILGISIFIVVLSFADRRPIVTFDRLAEYMVLFGTVISLIGLIIYFFGRIEPTVFGYVSILNVGPLEISQRMFVSSPFYRISSLLGNPNTLASWLLVTLTMAIYLISKGSHQFMWGLMALIQVIAILITSSRAGIAATIISLILFKYLSTRDGHLQVRKLFPFSLFVAFLTMVYALFSFDLHQIRILSADLNLRELAWEPLWESILNNPLLGVGFGVSYEAILEPTGLDFSAHNVYLAILSEMGLPFFLIFMLIWLIPIWQGRKLLRFAPAPVRLILATSLAILIAMISHEIFELNILRYGFHTILWTYLLTLIVHPSLMEDYIDV